MVLTHVQVKADDSFFFFILQKHRNFSDVETVFPPFQPDFKITVVSPIHQYVDHTLHKAEKCDRASNNTLLQFFDFADHQNQVLSWRFLANTEKYIYISAHLKLIKNTQIMYDRCSLTKRNIEDTQATFGKF